MPAWIRALLGKEAGNIPGLAGKEAVILALLIARGELYGLQLVEASDGELKRGTVYVTLARMEDKGFVESRQEEKPEGAIGLPRRMYKPTGLGERVFKAWQRLARDLVATVPP